MINIDLFAEHCHKVAFYACRIAGGKFQELFTCGLLHDLGKSDIPRSILGKKKTLLEKELKIIRSHSEVGANIAKNLGYHDDIVNVVLHHHERWDGKGYPHGLTGDKIPRYSRILAVADAFDAMTSDRPYRKALPAGIALEEIIANAGTQFDPDVVEMFIKHNVIRIFHDISVQVRRTN